MKAALIPSRAAGKDDRGRADDEGGGLDQFFHLPKGGFDLAGKDEVGVDFAGDENIVFIHGERVLAGKYTRKRVDKYADRYV